MDERRAHQSFEVAHGLGCAFCQSVARELRVPVHPSHRQLVRPTLANFTNWGLASRACPGVTVARKRDPQFAGAQLSH